MKTSSPNSSQREDRPETRCRQVLAGDMGHDLDAAKPERFVQPVELGEGQLGSLERHRAEPREAVGIAAAHLGDLVVEDARRREAELRVGAVIGLARRRRDRLNVDPHMVHVGDTLLGRHALQMCPLAILPVDLLAPGGSPGFRETSARPPGCPRPSPSPCRS
jgi:hypothetical protein